jgi:hypothetical protein
MTLSSIDALKRLLCLCLASILTICMPTFSGMAFAQEDSTPEGPTNEDPFVNEAAPPENPSAVLVRQTALVNSSGAFSLDAEFLDAGAIDRDRYEVAVTVYQRVRDRTSFGDSVSGTRLGSALTITRQVVPDPEPDGRIRFSFQAKIGTCDGCIRLIADGVYPVVVELRRQEDGGVAAGLITHLVLVTNAEQPVLSIAVLLPITFQGRLTASPDPETISQLVTASESLANSPGTRASLAITPSITDVARRNPSVDGILDALNVSLNEREIFAGPYVDLRTDIESDPRLVDVVAAQYRLGEDRLNQRFAGNVTSSTGVFLASDALPNGGFSQLGLQRMVIAEALLAPAEGTSFDRPVVFDPGPSTDASGNADESSITAVSAVVADQALGSHLSAADPTLGVHRLLADLSLLANDGGRDRGVVVAIPPTSISRKTLDRLFGALNAQPQLRTVQVSELFDLPAGTQPDGSLTAVSRRVDSPETRLGTEDFSNLDQARRHLDAVSLTFSEAPTGLEQGEQMFSQGLTLNQAEAAESIQEALAIAVGLLSSVRLGGGGPFRLTALKGRIPLSLINQNSQVANVVVVMRSDRVLTAQRIEISADGAKEDDKEGRATVTPVNVSTRSSGTFGVVVALQTMNGIQLDSDQLIISSTGVSGFGVGLTAALLALLLIWWARTRRKAARTGNIERVTDLEP